MANIVIVDTSILLNILDVPFKNDQRAEVAERLKDHIRKGDQLFLPIATVLETGNHIAQNGDGNQKRKCALRFVETVRMAVTDSIPWALTPLPDNETLVSWLDDFPDSAGVASGSVTGRDRHGPFLSRHRRPGGPSIPPLNTVDPQCIPSSKPSTLRSSSISGQCMPSPSPRIS